MLMITVTVISVMNLKSFLVDCPSVNAMKQCSMFSIVILCSVLSSCSVAVLIVRLLLLSVYLVRS